MSDANQCSLLGPLGLSMQAAITAVCATVLVAVWWMEAPRRPFLVWGLDISKQVVGAAYGKLYNILQAIVLSRVLQQDPRRNDQCVWYLMGIVTDCFVTTFLCWLATRSLRPVLRSRCGIDIGAYEHDGFQLGTDESPSAGAFHNAQEPPLCLRGKYSMYSAQLILWLLIITCARLVVSAGFFVGQGILYDFYRGIFEVLRLREPATKMIFAVLVFPAMGDAFQIVVQDCFLKKGNGRADETELSAQARGLVQDF